MTIRPAAHAKNRETTFYVTGDSGTEWTVHHKRNSVSHRKVWTCNCPDWTERRQFNGTDCKHIDEVQADIAAKALLESAVIPHLPPAYVTIKELLDALVQKLNGPQGRLLWDVISALRGPDSGEHEVKLQTTATLRGALGLEPNFLIVSKEAPLGVEFNNRWDVQTTVANKFNNEPSHFINHYAAAVLALKSLGYIK